MIRFLAGFAIAYLIAAVYFGAVLLAADVVRPRAGTPLAALAWPVTMAPVFRLSPPEPRP